MLTLNLFTLTYPSVDSPNYITVSPTGDTIISLPNVFMDDTPSSITFTFLVSSTVLCQCSGYFANVFTPDWNATCAADSKYHFTFPNKTSEHVSLDVLVDIMWATEYFQPPAACDSVADCLTPWFKQFLREHDRQWDLPRQYDQELMMYWCLARCFQPTVSARNEIRLQMAIECVVFAYKGTIEDFGWSTRPADLEDLETRHEWHAACMWD
ncbi:hypothetical protein SVAN01_00028 [Stagonosporopsis vannaccii]|nr:hypothetical protein SVAN01_00028 [Stagonosporopsis vannaccii]